MIKQTLLDVSEIDFAFYSYSLVLLLTEFYSITIHADIKIIWDIFVSCFQCVDVSITFLKYLFTHVHRIFLIYFFFEYSSKY